MGEGRKGSGREPRKGEGRGKGGMEGEGGRERKGGRREGGRERKDGKEGGGGGEREEKHSYTQWQIQGEGRVCGFHGTPPVKRCLETDKYFWYVCVQLWDQV